MSQSKPAAPSQSKPAAPSQSKPVAPSAAQPAGVDKTLPIDEVIPELQQTLAQHRCAILVAAPGAGKTTRVPLALMQSDWLQGRKILMLEPRRIATRNAATFMAQQLGERVGQQIGYRMRSESRASDQTRVEVITEGMLTRRLLSDPELSDVGLIIFDEFHERNLHSDLGLALAHNCQQVFRDDLKLLVMSATLDEQALATKLDAPVVYSDGRSFDVETHYRPASQQFGLSRAQLTEHCLNVIQEALRHSDNSVGQTGDILVFLPGVAEIEALQRALANTHIGDQHCILPLHGRLTDAQQKQALSAQPRRKIILATNIAESSVTIDGVRIVIDSGLERIQQFDVRSGIERLETATTSRASADQRRGRAGRQAPGLCYRLWSENSHATRAAHLSAEIERSDLSWLAMCLSGWGMPAEELTWLSPPSSAALSRAQQLLQQLDIITEDSTLTRHGEQLLQTGLEPRWAHAISVAAQLGFGQAAAHMVAALQLLQRSNSRQDDGEQRLKQLSSAQQQQASQLAAGWIRTLAINADDQPLNTGMVIALAYPDRIARQRANDGRYLLAGGSGAQLSGHSTLLNQRWLAVADIGGQHATIRLAHALTEHDIEQLVQQCPHLLTETLQIAWQESGHLKAEVQQRLGQIVLRSKAVTQLTSEQWQSAWLDYLQRHGLQALPWDDACRNLCQRIRLVKQTEADFPDMDDDALLKSLEAWLLPLLSDCRSLKQLGKIDLYNALLQRLDWNQQQRLQQLAPTHWTVSSGSQVRIDYQPSPPVLAVKLQEMFGTPQQPCILNGRVPLTIHLLSPAQRPLAVTQDLASFWQNAYPEVRKDMRGRYPKHPWPEDPLTAEATRHTKRKM